jgi:thiol:disulfide interchange protein
MREGFDMKMLLRAVSPLVVSLALLLLGSVLFAGCSRQASEPVAASSEVKWVHDLEAGLKQAADEDKPLMVDFYTEWCGWCGRLDEETYADRRVQEKMKHFVAVKVDAEKNEAARRKYRVDGFPTILFLNARGEEIHRVPGFAPPGPFLSEMDKALAKAKKS